MNKINVFLIFAVLIGTSKLQIVASSGPASVYENILTQNGYHFRYKTEDSERAENGVLDATKGESGVITVSGSYSFVATDGRTYRVDYVADENGYRPFAKSDPGAVFQKPQDKPTFRVPVEPYIGSAVLASLTGGGIG